MTHARNVPSEKAKENSDSQFWLIVGIFAAGMLLFIVAKSYEAFMDGPADPANVSAAVKLANSMDIVQCRSSDPEYSYFKHYYPEVEMLKKLKNHDPITRADVNRMERTYDRCIKTISEQNEKYEIARRQSAAIK